MSTYRFARADWDSVLSSFSSNQGDYGQTAIFQNAKIDVSGNPALALDYMDQYHCDALANNEFVCSAYQPDYRNDNENEGYPRFGTVDFTLSAGLIDVSLNSAIAWD